MLMAQRKQEYPEYYDDIFAVEVREKQPYLSNTVNITKKATSSSPKKISQTQKAKLKALFLMLAFIGIFGIIGAKTVEITIVKGAELSALEKEIQALSLENDLLQVEVDKLRSVARIEEVALAMGMEKPEGTIYIASNLMSTPAKNVGVEQNPQSAAVQAEGETGSLLDKILKVFTSFFASTQR